MTVSKGLTCSSPSSQNSIVNLAFETVTKRYAHLTPDEKKTIHRDLDKIREIIEASDQTRDALVRFGVLQQRTNTR